MQEHIVSPYATLPCTGTYTAPEDRSHRTFHNWDPNVNQAMDLPTALGVLVRHVLLPTRQRLLRACRTTAGSRSRSGRSRSASARRPGRTPAPRSSGLVPTIGWRHQRYTPKTDPGHWQVDRLWKPGDSIQLAIGQGDLLVTPLQMARFYALIANGGKLVTPHLLDGRREPERDGGAGACAPGAAAGRRRPGRAPGRPPGALRGNAHRRSAPRTPSSARSRCRSPARPARRRRS